MAISNSTLAGVAGTPSLVSLQYITKTNVSITVVLGFATFVFWVRSKMRKWRAQFPNIPQLPRSPMMGNMKDIKKFSKDRHHPDHAFEKMWKILDMPPMFVVDAMPFMNVTIIADPFIAEQITTSTDRFPHGGPRKSWTQRDLTPIIGKHAILTLEGEEWRQTRKRFAPGFQPAHIKSVMLPMFVEQAKHFVNNIAKEFEFGKPFELATLTRAFTLDVIGLMVLNKNFHTQTVPDGEGMRAPGALLSAFNIIQGEAVARTRFSQYLNLKDYYVKWRAAQTVSREFQRLISEALDESEKDKSPRSIIALSLKKQELTPKTLEHAAHQLRAFIFAGYDTTASTIAWTLYYLGQPSSAKYLAAVLKEIEENLGTTDEDVERNLCADVNLPLLTNVFREILRLHPPAALSRWVSNDEEDYFLTLPCGERVKVNDTIIMVSHRLLQTHPKIWGDSSSKYDSYGFHPDRWADKEYMDTIPLGAWRPFERGARDCIGQEVARTELKVVVAMTVTKWRFEKVTRPEDVDEELGEVWGKYNITTVPSDGMRGVVKRRI